MEVNYYAKLRQLAWGASLLAATTVYATGMNVRTVSANNDSSVVFVSDETPSAAIVPDAFADDWQPSGTVTLLGDKPKQAAKPTASKPQPAPSRIALFSEQSNRGNSGPGAQQPSRPSAQNSLQVRSSGQKPTLFSQRSQNFARKPAQNSSQQEQPPSLDQISRSQNSRSQTARTDAPASGTEVARRDAPKPKAAADPFEIDEVGKLLLEANHLAQQAASEDDYTQVIQLCATAIRGGARGENKQYAADTISWSLNRRGQLYSEQERHDLADADFHSALEFNAQNWRALHNRAVSFAEARQFAEAFDDFTHVIELNPKFAKGYTNRATLFMQAGDLVSAKLDYEQACDLDDSLVSARIGLGRVCHLLGDWEDAIDHFTLAMQLDPENADVVCSRGDLLADMGRYREALADYAHTIEIDAEFAHAYRNGAWLLATCPDERFRDPENALLGARQALEFDYGDRHVALDTLAAAWAAAGQFDQAVQTMEEAIAEAPAMSQHEYQARIKLYQQGQPYRAEPVGEVWHATYEVSDQ